MGVEVAVVVSSSDLLQALKAKGVRSPDMSRALGTHTHTHNIVNHFHTAILLTINVVHICFVYNPSITSLLYLTHSPSFPSSLVTYSLHPLIFFSVLFILIPPSLLTIHCSYSEREVCSRQGF